MTQELNPHLAALVDAPAERLPRVFRALLAALSPGAGATADTVAELTGALRTAPDDRRAQLVIALGLLADADDPRVRAALRGRLAEYLALVRGADPPLLRSLLYLLGHFPEDRRRVLAGCADAGLSPDEASRLDRSLDTLDPRAPVIGPVWPSPLAWSLDRRESAAHLAWARSLPAEVVAAAWRNDTGTLHAYSGAKALWSVEHGLPPDRQEPEVGLPTVPRAPAGSGPATWARFADAVRCPACRSALAARAGHVSCVGCAALYADRDGCLDLGVDAGPGEAVAGAAAARYERTLRPAVLRLTGTNWAGALTPADEDAYLLDQVRPVAGPVVDVGCGPGRWTAQLASAFGQDRVIALDSSPTMLRRLGARLPDVARITGDAQRLPFADASLGAVNVWNTLQALPDPAATLAEVGRCLRPGGTLTLLTFRPSTDPAYAHFQRRLTVRTFEPDVVAEWLEAARMSVRTRSTPGTLLLLTAVRDPA